MQHLTPDDYQTMPWKNGGGITHEIALADGPNGFAWRLSIAEVATSGPFSTFEGKARILTVIDGPGIDLVSPEETLTARIKSPVAFSGETNIDGRLVDGPIRDFNLIFDPMFISASVKVVDGNKATFETSDTDILVVHSVTGQSQVDETMVGAAETLFPDLNQSPISVSSTGWAIVVQLTQRAGH